MLPAHSAATEPRFATAVEVSLPELRDHEVEPLGSYAERSVTTETPSSGKAYRWLLGLFALSLVLMNPWVRGDGVGYYAFARALLIQHNLDFTADYNSA